MRIRYSSNVTLQADTYYPLLIYFGERTGGDRIDFGWQKPGWWVGQLNLSVVLLIITIMNLDWRICWSYWKGWH